jgi:hypothetical protein
MNWLGLDWLGLILAVLVLAIIPGLLAAYGGHIAAEAISDPKRSRNVKYCFWALFLFGVLATSWQQFRSAVADLDRDTKETWAETVVASKFLPPPPPANIERQHPAIPRSYVVLSDIPKFAGGDAEGKPIAVGESISFNLYYKQQGPNSVDLVETARWLYVKESYQLPTQKEVISDFEHKLKTTDPSIKPRRSVSTLMPGETRFFSASAVTEQTSTRVATQTDLDNLRMGNEVIFIVIQMTYLDAGKKHHLRRCLYLQLPASPPGIWHFCDAFMNSD